MYGEGSEGPAEEVDEIRFVVGMVSHVLFEGFLTIFSVPFEKLEVPLDVFELVFGVVCRTLFGSGLIVFCLIFEAFVVILEGVDDGLRVSERCFCVDRATAEHWR